MQQFKRILKMDFLNLLTNPIWIAFGTLYYLAIALVLGFLTSNSYGNRITSYDYYAIAVILFATFNAATFSANSFMEEKIKSPNMRILYSPISPFFIPLSKVIATTLFCMLTIIVDMLILHLITGAYYGGIYIIPFMIIIFISTVFFSILGVWLCCMLKSESSANQILSTLIVLLSLLGGIFFPVDGWGKTISILTWISPIKWILNACMQIIFNHNMRLFIPTICIFIIISGVLLWSSARKFKGEDYL